MGEVSQDTCFHCFLPAFGLCGRQSKRQLLSEHFFNLICSHGQSTHSPPPSRTSIMFLLLTAAEDRSRTKYEVCSLKHRTDRWLNTWLNLVCETQRITSIGSWCPHSSFSFGMCSFYTAWLYRTDLSHWMTQLLSPQGLFSKRTHGRAPVCLTSSNCIQPAASQFMVGNSLGNKKLQLYFLPHCEKLNFTWLSFLSLLEWLQKLKMFHLGNNICQCILPSNYQKRALDIDKRA